MFCDSVTGVLVVVRYIERDKRCVCAYVLVEGGGNEVSSGTLTPTPTPFPLMHSVAFCDAVLSFVLLDTRLWFVRFTMFPV